MKLAPYKLVLIALVTLICLILVVRIKDKIVAQWLGVVLRYQTRPKYWLYNKNDLTNRTVDVPDLAGVEVRQRKASKKVTSQSKAEVEIPDLVRLQQLLESGKVAVYYQMKN